MSLSNLLLPLIIVLFAVPLYLGTRKQKRVVAKQQEMQNSLSFGDRVMTTSGLHATVVDTTDDSIDLEIAPGVVTTWLRAAVREKVADTTFDADDASEIDDDEFVDTTETEHDAAELETAEHEAVEDAVPAKEKVAAEESAKKAL
jgi:preprotein translocase subunit YajC